jgi:hypothetical protein
MQLLVTETVMMKEDEGGACVTVTLMTKLVDIGTGSSGKEGVHEQIEDDEEHRTLTQDALNMVGWRGIGEVECEASHMNNLFGQRAGEVCYS